MAGSQDNKKIEEVLTRRVEKILPGKEGLADLMRKRKIRLYLGVDPTGSRLHLGHTVPLKKLQEFADLGHDAFLVVGTGTVLAGDPSQRKEARSRISQEEIKENIKTWKKQAAKILDFSKIKIVYNGDWLLRLGLKEIIEIASNISAVKLFQREMFQERLKKGDTVWMHEALYPLLQGYDSVFLDVDLELGGSDQVFNMLIGRELQQKMRKKEKYVLTGPMAFGLDGKPMSKSTGNCVWLEDDGKEMFGKIMSLGDDLIISYFELMTQEPQENILRYKEDMNSGKANPRDIKEKLAFEIVKTYHSLEVAQKAKEQFISVFKNKELPSDIPKITFLEQEMGLLDFLVKIGMADSKSNAKRLIVQGGLKIDGKTEEDWHKMIKIKKGMIVQSGKRKFAKVI